jgi:hypothetical protein
MKALANAGFALLCPRPAEPFKSEQIENTELGDALIRSPAVAKTHVQTIPPIPERG